MRAAILVICILLLGVPPAAGEAPEPSFFGVQGWRSPGRRDELRSLQRAGVGSVRVGFNRATRGRRGRRSALGRARRARRGRGPHTASTCCRCSSTRPTSATGQRARPPRTPAARREWAGWVEEAVERYGPNGSLWIERPRHPLPAGDRMAGVERAEPARALAAARRPRATSRSCGPRAAAIRDTDPQGTVVLAGIPNTLPRHPPAPLPARALPAARLRAPVRRDRDASVRARRRAVSSAASRWCGGSCAASATSGGGSGSRRSAGPPAVPTRRRFRVSVEDQAERLNDAFDMFIEERERWRLERVFWFSLRDRDLSDREPDWFGPHTGPLLPQRLRQAGLARPSRPSPAGSPTTGSTAPSASRRRGRGLRHAAVLRLRLELQDDEALAHEDRAAELRRPRPDPRDGEADRVGDRVADAVAPDRA